MKKNTVKKTWTSVLDALVKDLDEARPGSATELDQRFDLVIAKIKIISAYISKYLEPKV